MKLRSSSWLFFALVVVVALFGSACTDEKEWTQKVPEKDPCPDAVVVAGERHFDDGVLLEDTVITPPPICWYRVQGDDTLEPCSPATTKRTLDHARRSPHRFDENDGFVDSPIGVIVCLTTGRVLSIPATAATCAPTITPNEVW
jgi:hypothetical protein